MKVKSLIPLIVLLQCLSVCLAQTTKGESAISSATNYTALLEKLIQYKPYTGVGGWRLSWYIIGSANNLVIQSKDKTGKPTKIHGQIDIKDGIGKIHNLGVTVLLHESEPFALIFDDREDDFICPKTKFSYENEEERMVETNKYFTLQRKYYYDKLTTEYNRKYPKGYVGAEYLKYETRNVKRRQKGTKTELVEGPDGRDILVDKDISREVDVRVDNLFNTTNHSIYVLTIGRIIERDCVQTFTDYTREVHPNDGLNTNFDRFSKVETGANYWKSHESGIYIFGVMPGK